ncbi:MAG: hypothetical protein AAB576_07475 [Elusimicrobiota bacterium]
MTSKDGFFLALLAALTATVLAPILLQPALMAGNFGDLYSYHLPLRHLAASRLQSGQLPFWNPYIFSGLPLLANPQSSLFYPPSLLFQVLPAGYAFTLFYAFHLLWGAFGMQLLLRKAGLDGAGACVLAVSFALSPFLIYRIPQGIPTHLAALSHVPWCWLALLSGRVPLLAAAWSLQFLSGHPQFSLINAIGMAGACALSRERLFFLFKAGAAAAALSVIQLFPTAEFLSASNRSGWPAAFATAYSMPPKALAALVLPGFFGDPLAGDFRGFPSEFFELYSASTGWVPVLLALAGLVLCLRAARIEPAFGLAPWGLAAAGAFLALGGHNPLVPWPEVPLLNMLRVPARFSLLLVWGILLAAASGWLLLKERLRPGPWPRALLLALACLDLLPGAARFVYAEDPAPFLAPSASFSQALGGRMLRFATEPDAPNADKAMLYRAMNLNGYDAFYLRNYMEYAGASEGGPAADPSRTYIRRLDTPRMRALGAAYALSAGGLIPVAGARTLGRVQPTDTGVVVYSPRAERWIFRDRPDGSPAAAAKGPRTLVFAMPHFPGWRAWVNGSRAPIRLEEGLLQAVDLPEAGPWRALFRFEPTAWVWLCLGCAASWMLWLRSVLVR